MTFPAFAEAPTETDNAGVTTHTVNLPATVNAGDLLIVFAAMDGNAFSTWDTSGWTQVQVGNRGNDCSYIVYAKSADGTEDGGTAQFTTSAGEYSGVLAGRITGWDGTIGNVTASTNSETTSINPDTNSVTAPSGSGDNLFISFICVDSYPGIDTYPSNYTGDQYSNTSGGGGGSGVGAYTCSRNLAAASDDPGTWTLLLSDQWCGCTIVVQPSSGATLTDVNLVALTGIAQASLSSLRWSWFDSTTPSSFGAPVIQGTTESTDGSGNISLTLTGSSLTTGQEGTLVLSNSGGTIIGAYRLAVD